jgi:macrolide transport system ATP-binding/permease protein
MPPLRRLWNLLRRGRIDDDLRQELATHLALLEEEERAGGLSVEQAERKAQARFGSPLLYRERAVDAVIVRWLEDAWKDIRFAIRQLRKHPGFAATAIIVLAVGLAANAAIFGFVDAALIRPLPYREPSRLVTAFAPRPDLAQSQGRGYVSYLNFLDWRTRNQAFSAIAAYDIRPGFTLTIAAGSQRVPGLRVTSGFFSTLGVTPVLGREFLRHEEGPSAPPRVMLAYSAWQTRFAGRTDVLGQTVMLNGEPHVIIGVLPRLFSFPMAEQAEFWGAIRGPQPCWEARGCRSLETVARLADGVSMQTATANLNAVVQQLRHEYPDPNPTTAKVISLRDVVLGDVRPIMLMLLSGAALLLLIACINVVSLLLVRSDSRTREMAIRSALGASSARLLLQFATEAVILALAGTLAALALAKWIVGSLVGLLRPDMISRMPYLQDVRLNVRVIGFACAIALLAAVVFTLTPVVRLFFSERLGGLKEASRSHTGNTWRRFGSGLVVAEIAIAVILLVGAGLLGKSLYRLVHVDTGFNTRQLVVASVGATSIRPVSPAATGAMSRRTDQEQPGALARQVAERVAALPGVETVGYADLVPLGPGLAPTSGFKVIGHPTPGMIEDHPVRRISAGYFTTLQARLRRGRYFTDEDVVLRRPVVIINESGERRYFPSEDAIGQSIALGGNFSTTREIIGIVADIKDGPLESSASPAAYIPFDEGNRFSLVVRASADGQSLLPSLVAAIRGVRPDLLVDGEMTMTERMNSLPSASLRRSSAWLVGGFAATAFLLSVIGLYGVISYSVAQRTREIGVRMALGAQRRSVYQLVMRQAASLVAVGTVLGIVCAIGAGTLMRRLLFGVQSWDAPTLITAAMVLVGPALVASYVPARRAAHLSPIDVLRTE